MQICRRQFFQQSSYFRFGLVAVFSAVNSSEMRELALRGAYRERVVVFGRILPPHGGGRRGERGEGGGGMALTRDSGVTVVQSVV